MATAWQLRGEAWQVHGQCMATAWQLHGNCAAKKRCGCSGKAKCCMATAWQVHGKRMATAWQLHGNCMANAWQLHGNCAAIIIAAAVARRFAFAAFWLAGDRCPGRRCLGHRCSTYGLEPVTWTLIDCKPKCSKYMASAWQLHGNCMASA